MNICMMTNTYYPIVGGLEKSVEIFSEEYRKRGHHVLIVCPEDDDAPASEKGVFRVPAIQNFNNTDFSVELPIPNALNRVLEQFKPDIVHTHHPFLIGDTALRIASQFGIPIVFTHHTMYEENTHYVPLDSKAVKKFVVELSKGYANLCDHVIAPSQSVADLIKARGVKQPVHVIPTGIYLERFRSGSGSVFRKFFDIPRDAFVIGHAGRVAPEKNIFFLANTIKRYLQEDINAFFVLVGDGPSLEDVRKTFRGNGLDRRLISTGFLHDHQLVSAYKSLDVFAVASHSETQGIVLMEAMAAGAPVVGVDAPGIRDVVADQMNGKLISRDNENDFIAALRWVRHLPKRKRGAVRQAAKRTAAKFSVDRCVDDALKVYETAIREEAMAFDIKNSHWQKAKRVLRAQAELISNYTKATGGALIGIPEDTIKKLKQKFEQAAKK